MLRITKQLAFGLILILPLIAAGCASPDYRASSKIKWHYYAPADPWPNQKLGVCCFVYDDPLDEQTVVARSEQRPANREVQEMTAAPAANEEAARLTQELRAARSANSALENEKTELARQLQAAKADALAQSSLEGEKAKLATQLDTAQAELTAKSRENQALASRLEAAQAELSAKARLEKENAEAADQLQLAKRELAARAAQDQEKVELARQLEDARKETERLKAAQAELALRLGRRWLGLADRGADSAQARSDLADVLGDDQ